MSLVASQSDDHARRSALRHVLFRLALRGDVDLGDHRSIVTGLREAGCTALEISLINDDDLDAVRRRLQRRTLIADKVDEGGTVLLFLLLVLSWLVVYCLLCPAHAATGRGPEPSRLAGFAIALVPIAIAAGLAAVAIGRRPRQVDDEAGAFDDTTGPNGRGLGPTSPTPHLGEKA